MFELLILGTCSLTAVFAATMVLLSQNPVHSVRFLVLSFASSSGMMRLVGAEFRALLFRIVYVGAIAILFLFVVMMLNLSRPSGSDMISDDKRPAFQLALLGLLLFATEYALINLIGSDYATPQTQQPYVRWSSELDTLTNIETLGQVLYTEYSAYVVLVGFVLLAAMLGAILLTLQERRFAVAKRQQAYQQISRDSSRAIRRVR
jgi:NADH-quinone oxidoreductase subunit J